jgi:hypothetical protein
MMKTTKSNVSIAEKLSKAASTNSGRIHIVEGLDGWSVKREGAIRASAVKTSKINAVRAARMISDGKIILHKKDGTIREITR